MGKTLKEMEIPDRLTCLLRNVYAGQEATVRPGHGTTDFPGGSDGKVSAYNTGDPGSIPGLGRSPAEENNNPLQYSCLENPTDRGTWWATVHSIAKSQITTERLSMLTHGSERLRNSPRVTQLVYTGTTMQIKTT